MSKASEEVSRRKEMDPRAEKNDSPLQEKPMSDPESCDTNALQIDSTPLSLNRLLIVGACMTLTSIINGYSVTMTAILLDLLAEDLQLAENNLQWTFNSFLLPMVSHPSLNLFSVMMLGTDDLKPA